MLGSGGRVLLRFPGGADKGWIQVRTGSDPKSFQPMLGGGLKLKLILLSWPPFPTKIPVLCLTCSRSAVFRSLYTNSPTATNTDRTRPAAKTMKMPPIFWMPRALASLLSSSGHPLPRHHFSFMTCSLSSSCSCRIAMVILSRYGEPGRGREEKNMASAHQPPVPAQ